MKSMQMPKELGPILKLAEASRPETVILTVRRRPVAALVSLRNVDQESLALSTNPQFCGIVDAARQEVRSGRTSSLEELERKFGSRAPAKALKGALPKRRRSQPPG